MKRLIAPAVEFENRFRLEEDCVAYLRYKMRPVHLELTPSLLFSLASLPLPFSRKIEREASTYLLLPSRLSTKLTTQMQRPAITAASQLTTVR